MKQTKIQSVFKKAETTAESLIAQQSRLQKTLEQASARAQVYKGQLQKMWTELELLVQLVRSYARGEYRRIPWKSIVLALAAILYFVNPFDAIPDFLSMFGFVDDAAVIGIVVNTLKEELETFKMFLEEKLGAAS